MRVGVAIDLASCTNETVGDAESHLQVRVALRPDIDGTDDRTSKRIGQRGTEADGDSDVNTGSQP
jgi:hypothetical protein